LDGLSDCKAFAFPALTIIKVLNVYHARDGTDVEKLMRHFFNGIDICMNILDLIRMSLVCQIRPDLHRLLLLSFRLLQSFCFSLCCTFCHRLYCQIGLHQMQDQCLANFQNPYGMHNKFLHSLDCTNPVSEDHHKNVSAIVKQTGLHTSSTPEIILG
jgi:hypothetical protein